MEIKLVMEDFSVAHKDLTAVKEELKICKSELETSYQSMKESWLGEGGNAFEEYYTKLFTMFEGNISKLEQLSVDLLVVKATMMDVDETIANNF